MGVVEKRRNPTIQSRKSGAVLKKGGARIGSQERKNPKGLQKERGHLGNKPSKAGRLPERFTKRMNQALKKMPI